MQNQRARKTLSGRLLSILRPAIAEKAPPEAIEKVFGCNPVKVFGCNRWQFCFCTAEIHLLSSVCGSCHASVTQVT